ncbi:MAG: hypothetical protein ACLPLZ_04185 [Terracidiphilus sp.]
MGSIIRKLELQALKDQLAASHDVCSSLAHEFETTALKGGQKAAIAHRWDKALKIDQGLQLALVLLERRDSESRIDAATRVAEKYFPSQCLMR